MILSYEYLLEFLEFDFLVCYTQNDNCPLQFRWN